MNTRFLIGAALLAGILPSTASAQIMWMGTSPMAVGPYRRPTAYGPGFYASSPRVFAPRHAMWHDRALPHERFIWVRRESPPPPGITPPAPGTVPGPAGATTILVTNYGLGPNEKRILEAIDEANSWVFDESAPVQAITDAALAETKGDPQRQKKLEALILAHEQLVKNLQDKQKTKDFATIGHVNQERAKFSTEKDLKQTLSAIATYLASSKTFAIQPDEISDVRRNAIIAELQKVISALKKARN